MARQQSGNKGQPIYLGTGAPADAADLTELGQYAADVGNNRVGSTNDRTAFGNVGAVTEGLAFRDTTAGRTYYWQAGAWVLENWGSGTVTGTLTSSGSARIAHGLGKVPSSVQIIEFNTRTASSGKRKHIITEVNATDFVMTVFDASTGSALGAVSYSVMAQVQA